MPASNHPIQEIKVTGSSSHHGSSEFILSPPLPPCPISHIFPIHAGCLEMRGEKMDCGMFNLSVPQNSIFPSTLKSFNYLMILFSSSNFSLLQMQHLHSFNCSYCDKLPDSIVLAISSVVQLLSPVQLLVTPWTEAHQASLSFIVSQSCSLSCPLSGGAIQPPLPLPSLLLLSLIFPSIKVFSNESTLHISGQSIGASASAQSFQ